MGRVCAAIAQYTRFNQFVSKPCAYFMTEQELKSRVTDAVCLFLTEDRKLLEYEAHEQAISHRIAVYLEPSFKGYHIDCEYNRHFDLSVAKKLKCHDPEK